MLFHQGIVLQAAEARVVEAQQSVPRLVAERWAAAGADRASWPPAAQVWPGQAAVGLLALSGCLLLAGKLPCCFARLACEMFATSHGG